MTGGSAAPGERLTGARALDLKWSLTLRVFAVTLVCFVVAAALALYVTYSDLRQANEGVADTVLKQLQVELFRLEANIDAPQRFPDWGQVIDRVQMAGQCIRYIKPDGSTGRSSCVGANPAESRPPSWISALGARMLGARTEAVRAVAYHGKAHGTLVVATDTTVILAAIWRAVAGLLGLSALVIVAICLLQYVAISRALRPSKDILVGLDRLSRGDLSHRLPHFGLIEFQRISEVFNALAANLDRTMHERTQLAARLVDGQEQERRHLARELHDELAQTLTAISATAASIKATAETECPGLASEAERLLQTSLATMRSLRRTLQNLRPPEIDDFGLATSLEALAKEQERSAGGKLQIRLDIEGDLRELPSTAASHVYRIVQEGLTNIGKHARASRARVALDFTPEPEGAELPHRRWLALTIEDDGFGAGNRGVAGGGEGLGLIGMRERAMALGGYLDVSRLDPGFRLRAVIPFGTPAESLR